MKKRLWVITLSLFLNAGVGYAGDGDLIVNGKLGLGTTTPTGIFEISGMISGASGNTIPTMTSNTTPSGVASADSEFSPDFSAWKAMNNDNSDNFCWFSSTSPLPHWLQYRFTSGKTIVSYSITSRNYSNDAGRPKAWKLQGSNDGSTWTDLDTQSGQSFASNEKKTYTFANPTSYTYYRLYISVTNDNYYAAVGEFALMESSVPTAASLFYVDNTTGNIGIGTTAPGNFKLNVNGSMYASSYYGGSDIRWKKNISPIHNALSLVQRLQGVRFEWRTDEFKDKPFEKGGQVGLIAQDVEPVIPEIVKTDKDGYKAISYEKLTAVLVEAIKEQNQKIKELEAMINKMKKKR